MSALPLTVPLPSATKPKSVPTHLASGERFVLWTNVHKIHCWPRERGGHRISRALFIFGQVGLQCTACDRRLYVVHHVASSQLLTVAATYDELLAIQRERMTEFEALHYLGVIAPPGARP